ncbi:uncharacterized protein LOC116133325 [Pistacia vera]|uniref:uncharacterized protein LOC116133325 n=1 Tax=Pistacia vera TaxID=55513 RepID=UPI001263D98D|nr:uncharacterized protein LOC116133325 [Pistacia vera]
MVEPAGDTASLVSVVLQVGKWFARPIGRRFMYLYNHRNNLDNLENEVQKLKDAEEEMKNKVVAAENNVEKIKQSVRQWQEEVNSIIHEAEQLSAEKANDQCFKGFCPNLIARYKHGKKAFEIKEDNIPPLLQQLKDFDEVSYPTTLEDLWLKPDKNYDLFISRDSTFKNTLKALNDANDNVGVYGMGGIGKTTLVKEIGRQAKKEKIFDVVVYVEVSKTLDIEKIQKEIARNLGVKFGEETQRASKLYERLKKKKEEKILIILDNLWDEFDLKSVGIPDEVDDRGCKLLLTARERQPLQKMGCPNPLQIDGLNGEESWKLFKTTAGDFIETQDFKSPAENICKKCGGLPIAIVTVAKALKNKGHSSQWKEALRQLKRSSSKNFTRDMKEAYATIELSYKYLKGEELQKTFLLCSLMPHQASSLDLVKYVIGLHMFQAIYTTEEAQNKVITLIDDLQDSCLLLNGHTYESFSMHDFVLEVALSIANRDDHVFSVRNEIKWEWPDADRLKICKKIFVHDSTIGDLSKVVLDCPLLEFLLMDTKVGDSHVKIPDNFFIGMKKLKVLDFTRMQFSSLPLSLGLLVNLQTLCLDYSEFEYVAIIGELKELKILSLQGSSVEQLPKEIGQLTQLKLLDLSNCKQLEVIAPNVLSNLVGLEELYLNGCSVLWEVKGRDVQRSNASLEELKHLRHLTTLEIDIEDDKIVPEGLFTKKLDRYKISIGAGSSKFGDSYIFSDWKSMRIKSFSFDKPITSIRTLKLKLNSTIWSDKLQGFKNVEFLCLDPLEGINNVVFDLDKERFSQLKHLRVHNNSNVLFIVDSIKCTPHDAFPALESLILFNLINLEKICYGQPTINSFSNLKIIEVAHCDKLKNIFSSSNSRSLPHLQTIHVADCENMKQIFVAEREDNVNNNEVIERVEFCQLCYLTLKNLPRIASFYSEVKTPSTLPMRQKESTTNLQSNDNNLEDELDTVTPLFNRKVVFPNLKTLELEAINSEMIWDNQLPTMSSCYQCLTRLIICNMEKLNYVFPSSMVKSFEQLQVLEITSCKELKEIIGKEEGAEAAATFLFSRVEVIHLDNLPKLTTFYPGIHTSSWPKLKRLEVYHCDNLHIFTSEYKVVFPNLEDVRLQAINSQMIWDSQLPIMSDCYQNLTCLVINSIGKLKYVFPSSLVKNFKQLRYFYISSCKELKEIIAKEGAEALPTFIFPRVESLILENLEELRTFYPGMHISEWPNLKKLEVSSCDKLQMSTLEYKVVLPNLEASELHGTNTENISQLLKTSSCSRKLTRLVLEKCEKIKYVFSSSMIKSFEQFQHLEISSCKELKEIVSREEGEETNAKFDFPHVAFLKLNDLPQLTTFCLGIRAIDWPWPKLKKLEMSDCDKFQMLTSENKISPNLEELELVLRADNMMTWQCLLPKNFSCKCTVEIKGDKSTNIPLVILQRSFDLEKLVLRSSSYKEIFSYGLHDRHTGTLLQIKSLELDDLSNLNNIWSKDSKVDYVIQNLEVLEVHNCDKLSFMLPPLASVANLTVLSIGGCWGLIKLFTPSTAPSMVQLREVNIVTCSMLIEVVSNEEDVGVEDGIVFNKLKLLSLWDLESLTCFCYGNFTFNFPALEELIVEGCPNMKTFSKGDTSAPCLQKVKKYKEDTEGYWKSDLNTTIQQLYKKQSIPSSEKDWSIFEKSPDKGSFVRHYCGLFPVLGLRRFALTSSYQSLRDMENSTENANFSSENNDVPSSA